MSLYVMECGCELKKEELIKLSNKTYRCPHHPKKRIKKIKRKCLDCDKILYLTTRQSSIVRCKECQVIVNKYIKKTNKREYITRRKKKKEDLIVTMNMELYTQGLSRYLNK